MDFTSETCARVQFIESIFFAKSTSLTYALLMTRMASDNLNKNGEAALPLCSQNHNRKPVVGEIGTAPDMNGERLRSVRPEQRVMIGKIMGQLLAAQIPIIGDRQGWVGHQKRSYVERLLHLICVHFTSVAPQCLRG
ncbi:hypothetical protein [Parasphingorhabdus sp.]|uniref:hypothetical protein n=1 Tax=Parasphingorhabdus sp. TaxID=2709688 RepID=UPI003A95A7A6